jgi:hypothetical protein
MIAYVYSQSLFSYFRHDLTNNDQTYVEKDSPNQVIFLCKHGPQA